jgi:hypothetical protein
MQYYIQVNRADVLQTHFSTRPAKFDGGEPGTYYEITVRKGSGTMQPHP